MILTRITFKDFALYAGEQEVLLGPSSKRNVTLVGGLNGAGKTSFLEGIQICLFGSKAPFIYAEKKKYSEYLCSTIHSGKSKAQQAGICLEFKLSGVHGDEVYVVDRRWKQTGTNSVKEELIVFVNGNKDPMLTDVWPEYVENILPPRLAPLFFFDGEQVERYAKAKETSSVLEIGLKALLGLDLIDQTNKDVSILRGQQRKKIKNESDVQSVDETLAILKDLEKEKSKAVQRGGSLENELFKAQKELSEIEQELQNLGGDLYEKREELDAHRKELEARRREIQSSLRLIAAEELPFALVLPFLNETQKQADSEETAKKNELVLGMLTERDEMLLKLLDGCSDDSLEIVHNFFKKDMNKRKKISGKIDTYLHLDRHAHSQLNDLVDSGLQNALELRDEYIAQLEAVEVDLVQMERQMAMIPDEEVVSKLLIQRQLVTSKVLEIEQQKRLNQERISTFDYNLTRARSRFEKILKDKLAKDNASADANRIVEFSFLVQEKLDGFKTRLTQKYLAVIEKEILKSFTQLCRKEAFVSHIQICPESLSLTLTDGDGGIIPPEKMSAGERQLLVISILWGLARAADKKFPFVIDTPLGRLDSKHREKLIKNFFAAAGDQVVLLSTDEEIDEMWRKKLSPAIKHSYLLDYDHAKRATKIKKGYFGGVA
jgi:DNA sulfur modification protein DndD